MVKAIKNNLLILIQKQNIDIIKINEYLNNEKFRNNFIFSCRFKIGHIQLSNSYILSDKIIIIQ